MNLLFLIGIPLLTAVAVLLSRNKQQVKWISLFGSVVQLGLAFALLFAFNNERATGKAAQMLFEQNYKLFASLNINFHFWGRWHFSGDGIADFICSNRWCIGVLEY